MTECSQHEELTVFGKMLDMFMERAEIAGPAELVERMHEAGYNQLSEKVLTEDMYGTWTTPGWAGSHRGSEEVLGLNEEEMGCLSLAWFESYACSVLASDNRGRELIWKAGRAMARRKITPLEELAEDELFSEEKVWWRARRDVANARYQLERCWVFEEEGEELIEELAALQERLEQLGRRVTRAWRASWAE